MAQPKPTAKQVGKTRQIRHVNIFSVGGKNVVWPPYLFVKEDEAVCIRAVNTSVTILLPKPAVLWDPAEKLEMMSNEGVLFQIPAGGCKWFVARDRKKDTKFTRWLKTKKLTKEYPVRGAYPYSVYCDKGGDFAEGNSSPVMLVEPPPGPPPRNI